MKESTFRVNKGKITKSITTQHAINYHCSHCMGWEDNPEKCTDKLCSLYNYRPDRIWGKNVVPDSNINT